MPKRKPKSLIQQCLRSFSFPNASLEAMPLEIKLQILLSLPDLPSLRCLKFASREYYLAARASSKTLCAKFSTEAMYTPMHWSLRFDKALVQAGHDWNTICNPKHKRQFDYNIPGHLGLNFSLPRNSWLIARIYYLCGEYPNDVAFDQSWPDSSIRGRKVISSYIHTLKWKFARRCTLESEDLCPEDIEWGERAAALIDEDGSMFARLAELREKGDLTRGLRRQQYRIDVVTEAMRRDPELTKRIVSGLVEVDGVVKADGEGWVLVKQGIKVAEAGEDGSADGETHSWRPLLPKWLEARQQR